MAGTERMNAPLSNTNATWKPNAINHKYVNATNPIIWETDKKNC